MRLSGLALRLLARSLAGRGTRTNLERQGRALASIVVQDLSGGPARRFPAKVVKLGRSKDADLTVEARGNVVSRLHAALLREGNELRVKDLGSREGTFVNDVRIKAPVLLEPDDVVKLGAKGPRFSCRLDVLLPAAPSPHTGIVAAGTSLGVLVLLVSMLVGVLRGNHRTSTESSGGTVSPVKVGATPPARGDTRRVDARGDGSVAAPKPEPAPRLEPAPRVEATPPPSDATPSAIAGLAGRYDLKSTETSAPVCLSVDESGRVIRSIWGQDRQWHSRHGTGVLSGTTLSVTLEDPGDPRDLSGEWSVAGSTPRGSYGGTAIFERRGDGWTAGFDATARSVRISGKLADRSLVALRADGWSANPAEVTYTLSENGLKLSAAWGQTTETFTRKRVPSDRPSCHGTYVFSGHSVTGTLEGGVKDAGALHDTRAAASAVTAQRAAPDPKPAERPDVAPDPVPTQLLTSRTTTLYKSPTLDAPTLGKVEKYTRLIVVERTQQFWAVALKDGTAYVPMEDMAPLTRQYREVKGPIFNDKPLTSSVHQTDLGICYLIAALLGIAQENPKAIRDMIRDNQDGTVSVRFYHCDEQAGQSHFEEKWLKINKSVVVDDEDQAHYAIGEGGQMWGPLIVKAFAVWHGHGFYSRLTGGSQGSVFQAILGHAADTTIFPPPLPFALAPATIERVLKDPKDRDAVVRFLGKEQASRSHIVACIGNPHPEKIDADRLSAEAFIEKNAMGFSPAGRKALLAHYEGELGGLGPLGSGQYSRKALDIYGTVNDALARHCPAGLGTRKWSTEGTGRSARENTDSVPGLATGHAYVVVGASEHDGLKWIKVLNPWGIFSRRYSHAGKTWIARGTNPDERFRDPGDDGVFEVELSDVMRFFWALEVGTR